jgi:hypothetical protein
VTEDLRTDDHRQVGTSCTSTHQPFILPDIVYSPSVRLPGSGGGAEFGLVKASPLQKKCCRGLLLAAALTRHVTYRTWFGW